MDKKMLLIFTTFVILITAAITLTKTNQSSDSISVGAIYTLSGLNSDIGNALREGTEIAVEEINANGGIHGKQSQIIFEDAPDVSPSATVNAAQKLMSTDRVVAVLDMSYTGLATVKNIAEQYHTPVIDVIDSSDEIATFGDWVMSTGIYADGVGREVADFARNEQKIRSTGVLVGKDEYLFAVSNGFTKRLKELGGTIVLREEFELGETDFRTTLVKMKQNDVQTIFVGHFGEAGYLVKQAKEIGYDGIFLGSDTFSIGDVQKVAGSALDDRTFFALWKNFDSTTPEQKQFAERYKHKYNKEPGDYLFYNVLGYDGMMVAAQALKDSDLSGEGIKDALYKIKDFPGLSGHITIDETGINRDPKSTIVTYKQGKIVRYFPSDNESK